MGHIGSYAPGEAKETSDIDINVVLDELHLEDLVQYRNIIHGMSDSGKACGFICGEAELRAWPRMELFQFMMGSRTLMGTLEGIVAPPEDRISRSISASPRRQSITRYAISIFTAEISCRKRNNDRAQQGY